jgi:hypothetical protein
MKEYEIIEKTLENLQDNLKIPINWRPGNELDGLVDFTFKEMERVYVVEVKSEVRNHQLPQIQKYKSIHTDLILFAEKIYPNVKKELRELQIPYAESNGNIYLEDKELMIWIENNKATETSKKKGNRAFTKTGLKVVFHFLLNPDLINQPHRVVAEKTGVGLGNIPQVLKGLEETGYLIPLNNRDYIWENRKDLIDRWITEYDTTLKPSLKRGKYKLRRPWQEIDLSNEFTVWGGEPAGDILTHHLRPEILTLYTKEEKADLLKSYQMVPDKAGTVEVFEMFWQNQERNTTAPPLLVYVDLMLSNDKRCRETAELIFNEYIQSNL